MRTFLQALPRETVAFVTLATEHLAQQPNQLIEDRRIGEYQRQKEAEQEHQSTMSLYGNQIIDANYWGIDFNYVADDDGNDDDDEDAD